MVNHYRTLLLNRDGATAPGADYPGEQYVPPGFVARRLSGEAAAARALLFGTAPDRAMLNWRLQELLTCVHACNFGDYLLAPDPRLTYWPFDGRLLARRLAGPVATLAAGPEGTPLYFLGEHAAASDADRVYHSWELEVLSSTQLRLTSVDNDGRPAVATRSYTTENGLSSPVTLSGSQLRVRFAAVTGAAWRIGVLHAPRRTLRDVIAAADARIAGLAEFLFGAADAEPYATFAALWNDHDQLPYRAVGLTLALAYRLAEANGG